MEQFLYHQGFRLGEAGSEGVQAKVQNGTPICGQEWSEVFPGHTQSEVYRVTWLQHMNLDALPEVSCNIRIKIKGSGISLNPIYKPYPIEPEAPDLS